MRDCADDFFREMKDLISKYYTKDRMIMPREEMITAGAYLSAVIISCLDAGMSKDQDLNDAYFNSRDLYRNYLFELKSYLFQKIVLECEWAADVKPDKEVEKKVEKPKKEPKKKTLRKKVVKRKTKKKK